MFVEAGRDLLNFPADLMIENPEASGNDVHIEQRKQTHLVTKTPQETYQNRFALQTSQ